MRFTEIEFIYILLLVLTIVSIECCAQYCLKKYSQTNILIWFVIAAVIYAIIAYLLMLSFRFEKLVIVNVMWGGMSAVFLSTMAYFVYNESLSYCQVLGIITILFGTLLLHL